MKRKQEAVLPPGFRPSQRWGIGDRLERNCPLLRVDQALVVEDCVRLAFLRWVAYW